MTSSVSRPIPREGNLKEFLILFFPILLMVFSTSLYVFVEKLLLARFSAQAMEAAVSAAYTNILFQRTCVVLVMMAQVCVGRWSGGNEFKMIGPGIWQFIWFSVLSMIITIPLGLTYGHYYFQGTAIEEIVTPYYRFLIFTNFLFPLGTALSSFFIGQGKIGLVLLLTIISQLIKLILAYLLIFGWEPMIPSLGLMGGAISTVIAQVGFCLVLFCIFLKSKYAEFYHSRSWKFHPKFFWECIQPGILRAMSGLLNMASWSSIVYLMTAKGGNYLLSLSIGGTLSLFLPFLGEAICQAQTTIVSQMLGARHYHLLNKAFRSGMIVTAITVVLLSIPLVFLSSQVFRYLFPAIVLDEITVKQIFLGEWIGYAFFTFTYVFMSYVLAFKDTKFTFFMGCVNWINGFLLMYVAIEIFLITPGQFWLVLSLMHGSSAVMYYFRMKYLQAKVLATA